jgi:hypothetical protein
MVILVSKKRYEWEVVDQIGKNFKKEVLADFAEQFLESLRKGQTEEEAGQSQSFLERLTVKIIDNIQIKINNIHIRYEVDFEGTNSSNLGLSLGLRLEQFYIVTTDEQWKNLFLDRTKEENKDKAIHKLLSLKNLSLYSDSSKNCFFSQIYDTDDKLADAFTKEEQKEPKDFNWIMKPIIFQAYCKLNKGETIDTENAKYWIKFIVDDFSLNLKKKELINLIKIMELITAYRKFQDSYNRTLKYKFLRPYYQIMDEEKDQNCKNYRINPNAKMWWRYVVECVRRMVKMKNGAPNQFKLSTQSKDALGKQYRFYFSKLFSHKQEMKERFEGTHGGKSLINTDETGTGVRPEILSIENSVLDTNERNQYDYILTALDLPTLKAWTSIVVKKHHEKFQEIEKQRKSKSGSFWSYLGWIGGSSEEEAKEDVEQANHESEFDNTEFHISKDEINEINKLVQNNLDDVKEEDLDDKKLLFEIHYACLKGQFHIEDD